jgi:hypothetical protein
MGSTTGTSNNHPESLLFGMTGKVHHFQWSAMGRKHTHLNVDA